MQVHTRLSSAKVTAVFLLALGLSGCVGSIACDYVPSVPNTPIYFPPPPMVHGSMPQRLGVGGEPLDHSGTPEMRSKTGVRRSTLASGSPRPVRLAPQTPESGSPEAVQEGRETARREREMKVQMRSICRGC